MLVVLLLLLVAYSVRLCAILSTLPSLCHPAVDGSGYCVRYIHPSFITPSSPPSSAHLHTTHYSNPQTKAIH